MDFEIGEVGSVFLDFPNGTEPIYKNRKRFYNIPANGIYKTKFSPNHGWMEFPEFYYENISPENKIPFEADIKKLPSDRIVAFGGTTGSINKDSTGKEKIRVLIYHVDNKAQIESSCEEVPKLGMLSLSE